MVVLKWLNDLLVNGVKLFGILLEVEMFKNGKFVVVMGFGVNCVFYLVLVFY